MFFKNKRLKEIEMLQKEKQELLEIKEKMLNTNNPDFIDISNVYIWKVNGIKNIVWLKERKIIGRMLQGLGPETSGYETSLIDVFNEKIIYNVSKTTKLERSTLLSTSFETGEKSVYGELYPIWEEEKDLLEYPDKKVPRYIMYKIFYKINNIDITNSKLEKLPKIKFLEKNK